MAKKQTAKKTSKKTARGLSFSSAEVLTHLPPAPPRPPAEADKRTQDRYREHMRMVRKEIGEAKFFVDAREFPRGGTVILKMPRRWVRRAIRNKGLGQAKPVQAYDDRRRSALRIPVGRRVELRKLGWRPGDKAAVELMLALPPGCKHGSVHEVVIGQILKGQNVGDVHVEVVAQDREKTPLLGVRETRRYFGRDHEAVQGLGNEALQPLLDHDDARDQGFRPGPGVLPVATADAETLGATDSTLLHEFINATQTPEQLHGIVRGCNLPHGGDPESFELSHAQALHAPRPAPEKRATKAKLNRALKEIGDQHTATLLGVAKGAWNRHGNLHLYRDAAGNFHRLEMPGYYVSRFS